MKINEEYTEPVVRAAKDWDKSKMAALAASIEDKMKKVRGAGAFGTKTKAQKAQLIALQKQAAVAKKASEEERKMRQKDDQALVRLALTSSYEIKEPELGEEAQGGITTGSIGSPTMATGEPARFGSSAIYAPKVGPMLSRKGDIKPKKKKKVREFTEYYFNN